IYRPYFKQALELFLISQQKLLPLVKKWENAVYAIKTSTILLQKEGINQKHAK
ncbi:hypothetical protein M5D96_011495, partial [Drosophila gunungcola]